MPAENQPAPPASRAPTLWIIIAFKILKGCAFVFLAVVMYCLSDNDLPVEFDKLVHFLRIHPGNKFFSDLAITVGQLTEARVLWAAAGTLAYSLFSLVEGLGLIFRVSWAGWLAIGESAFFIPVELLDLTRHFSRAVAVIFAINIGIVWYLYKNRERLFRHHHHPG